MTDSLEQLRRAHRDHWIICTACGRQAWPEVSSGAPWDEQARVLYASRCADCPRVAQEHTDSFMHWLCHRRALGPFNAVGLFALAAKVDGNCLALKGEAAYKTYLLARGFDVSHLPAAYAEWEAWRKQR